MMPSYNPFKLDDDTASESSKVAVKHDQGKPPIGLIDAEFLEDFAKVLAFGAAKYGAHNWRGGLNYSRIIDSILRHTLAISRNEDVDPESGQKHTAHIACNAMFLHYYLTYHKEFDDRYKPEGK